MRKFRDRVAVITGGASGIGKSIATRLCAEGARVIIADIDEASIDEVCEEIRTDGGRVEGIVVDVTREESLQSLAEQVFATYGNVHLLFNNAGVGVKEAKKSVWDISPKDWEWAYAVNVMGVVHGIRSFLPTMLSKGEEGHVINTSSGNGGISSLPTTPVYASSKAAVTSLSEVLHYQLISAGAKLQAHLLFPGPYLVNTNILNSDRARPDAYREVGTEPAAYLDMQTLASHAGLDFKLTEPGEVAEMAIDGIRDGQFWILSPLGASEDRLRARTRSILERSNPTLP